MRLPGWAAWLVGATLVACASPPPPATAHAPEEPEEHDGPAEEPAPIATVTLDAPERSRPPSTASYDEALSTPEKLDVHDERGHLTDGQLTGPMRGVINGCRVPPRTRVTIKTAVQDGRAIGVTVIVTFDKPKTPPKRPPSRAALKAEAKLVARIVACADRATRAITWPPSSRRDSFTTSF